MFKRSIILGCLLASCGTKPTNKKVLTKEEGTISNDTDLGVLHNSGCNLYSREAPQRSFYAVCDGSNKIDMPLYKSFSDADSVCHMYCYVLNADRYCLAECKEE